MLQYAAYKVNQSVKSDRGQKTQADPLPEYIDPVQESASILHSLGRLASTRPTMKQSVCKRPNDLRNRQRLPSTLTVR